MDLVTRRSLLRGGSALGLGAALASTDLIGFARAWAQESMWKPEEGAKLSLLRWRRFIQAEEDAFLALVDAFSKATGIPVDVASESLDDVQPKASVAANTGQGPDLVWGLYSLPHLFPDQCVDVTDVADYLAGKYGGFTESSQVYGKSGDKWIAIPVAFNGNLINYRKSSVEKAGFSEFPKDTAGFLELVKAMKANNTPAGFALGHASGDGNAWIHWALWAHGGSLVNENDEVSINSPETEAAIAYVNELYANEIAGTASWNDSFNNKAFLAGEVHMTNNGISIYVAAQSEAPDMAEDIHHASWPIGPVGRPTEFHICYPMLIFNYTPYPMAAKAFIAFMLDAENFNPWTAASQGYLTPSLRAYESHPVWTDDPKRTVFRDAAVNTLTAGYKGSVGEKAAAALADFIVLDMFANVATGRMDATEAMKQAERQARRIYR